MKARKPNETDEGYIKRLESANAELRKHNQSLTEWGNRVNESVTVLACEGSLAFQAMAEKAGVRSHPSVTAVVKMFDTISHPQWRQEPSKITWSDWPKDWDLDPQGAWSGDADMELNAGIAKALDYIQTRRFKANGKEFEYLCEIVEALEKPLYGILDEAMPERAARTAIDIPENASRDDLARVVNDLSWRALDLAQDMACTNEMLRRDLRAASYRRVCRDLYELAKLNVPEHNPYFDVKVLGGEEIPF